MFYVSVILIGVVSTCLGSTNQIRDTRELGPIPVSEGVARVEEYVSTGRHAGPPDQLVIVEAEPQLDDNRIFKSSPAPIAPPPRAPLPQPAPAPPSGTRYCEAGFSVRKANKYILQAPSKVGFQDVITNAGGWDSVNNEFRPRCAGTYFFTFHGLAANSDFTLALMKNGEYQVTAYGTKDKHESGSNSVLLFLNPGDVVYLQLQQGTLYEHPYEEAYNTFTGFLVNKF